jgi:hypothetical protein
LCERLFPSIFMVQTSTAKFRFLWWVNWKVRCLWIIICFLLNLFLLSPYFCCKTIL